VIGSTGSQPIAVAVKGRSDPGLRPGKLILHYKQTFNPLVFAFEQYWFCFQRASCALSLVQELVTVVAASSRDLSGTGDLKPLRRRLVCLDLWHLSSSLPALARAP
jgi:hypothetical protein